MGGKSYFCDYCRCYLKNNINVRKTHNSGLLHKIAKANYMRRYEDPRKILEEETAKVACTRFWTGYCKFGHFCQYTHYSPSQLKELEEIVKKLNKEPKIGTHELSKVKAKRQKRNRRQLKQRIPPSLRTVNYKTIEFKLEACQWG